MHELLAGSAALCLVLLHPTPLRRDLTDVGNQHRLGAAVADLREGFAYVVRTPWLLATLLFASVLILLIMGPIEVLIPFLIKDRIGGGPREHALVVAAFGIGGAIGSFWMATRRMPRRYLTVMNLFWGLGCAPLALLGVTSSLWVMVAAVFVVGFCFSAPMAIWGTLLQRRVPPDLLGRVASLDFFVSVVFMPLSMAGAGAVATQLGLVTTYLVAGLAPALIAVVAILWARLPADEIAHPLD